MTTPYTTGQITLTNGSAVVTGDLTGWDTALVAGGVIYPDADGNPSLPILSVDSDIAITAATKWQGVTGTYTYALVRDTAYLQQVSKNSSTLAQLISELAAGTIFKYDASGDLAGRATYDERPKDFGYLVSIGVDQPQLYVKASAASGDWSGPFDYGTGPMGPPTSLNFGATVTEAPSTPASVAVVGDGPYQLTFHIPRGADGDMDPVGGWALGNNYSAKQVVGHAGSSYVCKVNHTASAANEPSVGASWTIDWDIFVAKGDKGDQGIAGPMNPLVYDPQNVEADAFARGNHTGTQALSTISGVNTYATKAANYIALATDNDAEHRYTTTAVVSLTAAATLGPNWHYTAVADGGAVTIDPNETETINGLPTLIVPNGSAAKIICDGSNFFTVVRPSSWVAIGAPVNLAGLSNYDWTNLNYRHLRIIFEGSVSTGALVALRVSTNNGSSFLAGASDYTNGVLVQSGTSVLGAAPVLFTSIVLTNTSFDANLPGNITVDITNFNRAANCTYKSDSMYPSSSIYKRELLYGFTAGAAARNALRLLTTAGTFVEGQATLEGIR